MSIIFTHGTMLSGKSMRLIDVYLKNQDSYKIAILKPITDDRNGMYIHTRFGSTDEGTRVKCHMWKPSQTLASALTSINDGIPTDEYDIIIIDEAQFLNKKQVMEINDMSCAYDEDDPDKDNPLEFFLYGLKNTFKGDLFEGAAHILAIADETVELSKRCWCRKPAKQNAKVKNGEVVKDGDIEDVGYHYVPLCNKHYHMGMLQKKK